MDNNEMAIALLIENGQMVGYFMVAFVAFVYIVSFTVMYIQYFANKKKSVNDEYPKISVEFDYDLIKNSTLKEAYALHVLIVDNFINEWFRLNVLKAFSIKNYEATEKEFNQFKKDCINEYCSRYFESKLTEYIINNMYYDKTAFIKSIASKFDDIWYQSYNTLRNNS